MKPKTILIKDGKTIHCLNVRDIIYIHCESYLCTFVLQGGSRYSHSKSLNVYAKLLQPHHFIQISRNTLINVEHVSAIKSGNNNRKSALMSNGDEFPIAFRRWKELKNTIKLLHI